MINEAPSENSMFSKSSKFYIVVIMVILAVFESFSTDCFVPSLPAISNYFNMRIGFAQLAVSIYFLGYFAQIPYGFLSDCYGRKTIFTISCGVFILGSLFCVFSENYTFFILGRFFQGMGICAVALNRSVFCDIFSAKELKSIYSALQGIWVVIASIAPLVGGYMNHLFGWRSIFVLLLFLGLSTFLVIMFIFPETNNNKQDRKVSLSLFLEKIISLLNNRNFIYSSLCCMFCYAGLYIVFSLSPFIFQNGLKWTTVEYGHISFVFILMISFGAIANNFILKRYSEDQLMTFAVYTGLILSLILISRHFGLELSMLIIIPILMYCFLCGIILPNTFLRSTKSINKDIDAGVSLTTFSFIKTMGTAVIIFLVSLLHSQSPVTMGILLGCISIVMIFLLAKLKWQQSK